MKILESITNRYKKIAAGIAIVTFLAIFYLAMIPGIVPNMVTVASAGVFGPMGEGIGGAKVMVVEFPQFNTTARSDVGFQGNYTLDVPYDEFVGSTYTLRASAPGYGSNSTKVTLTQANHNISVNWSLYLSEPRYLPFLYDSGNYESIIRIFNPYNFNATADFTTYNNLDGLNKTMSFEIPVTQLGSRNGKQVASNDFLGGVKIVNTRPESLVIGTIRTISTNAYTIAPSFKIPSTTIQYLPFLYDGATLPYDSGIQVFNPYNETLYVNLTGYNSLTNSNNTINFSIPPERYDSRKPRDIVGGNFLGGVKVETSKPAIVQGNIRTVSTGTGTIAPAFAIPLTNITYLPFLYDGAGLAYDSGIQVFNPYNETLFVNLTGYNKMTSSNNTINFSIPAERYDSRKPRDIVGGQFLGSVKVETSKPALVQGNIRTVLTGTGTIAPAITMRTVTTQYIPFLNHTGSTFDSGIQVFNPYKVDIWANVTAYNLLTGLTTNLNFTIPPELYDSRTAKQAALGSDFIGSVVVETQQPALIQANIRTILGGTGIVEPALVLE